MVIPVSAQDLGFCSVTNYCQTRAFRAWQEYTHKRDKKYKSDKISVLAAVSKVNPL